MKNLKNIIVATHVFTTVPGDDLEKYLVDNKPDNLLIIGHPLTSDLSRPGPYCKLYRKGQLIRHIQLKNHSLPYVFMYFRDIILSIYWIITCKIRWDLYIGIDNLNTSVGLLLKLVNIVNKVVYYTIDFTPQRFTNTYLNNFYHSLDKMCVMYSNITWNVSPRIQEGREKVRNFSRELRHKQIVVPIGIWPNKKIGITQRDSNSLCYAGGLADHQGIDLVLESIPQIIKEIPDFKFILVGIGDYESELKKIVKKLNISKHVIFMGYQEKHEDVEKILLTTSIAAAMYNPSKSKWSYYADPSKIKSYLAAGLPVITTNLTHISEELVKAKCGIIIDYNPTNFAIEVCKFIKNKQKLAKYRNNAFNYSKQFYWENIYNKAFTDLAK